MSGIDKRIEALSYLGDYLANLEQSSIVEVLNEAYYQNQWFTIENSKQSLGNIQKYFLQKEILKKWVSNYQLNSEGKRVGLVLAGNIPAVGWHDVISTFLSGHVSVIKYSEKDRLIINHLIEILISKFPEFKNQFIEVEFLKDIDAVIATGSDNSARYFKAYFSKYPHIIRKNRNAIGILSGSESREELLDFGNDIFNYFGLGCRNVSKIYVPKNYDFTPLLDALHTFNHLVNHNKYKNNFDYNIALYLLNKVSYSNNGCISILEDKKIVSRISSLHYEVYEDKDYLIKRLNEETDSIQCLVSKMEVSGFKTFKFGQSQSPAIDDYADGVDTMLFLSKL
jgi:hypothetical protein